MCIYKTVFCKKSWRFFILHSANENVQKKLRDQSFFRRFFLQWSILVLSSFMNDTNVIHAIQQILKNVTYSCLLASFGLWSLKFETCLLSTWCFKYHLSTISLLLDLRNLLLLGLCLMKTQKSKYLSSEYAYFMSDA